MSDLGLKLDDLENGARRHNLVIYVIPEITHECFHCLKEHVSSKIFDKILEVKVTSIEPMRRLGKEHIMQGKLTSLTSGMINVLTSILTNTIKPTKCGCFLKKNLVQECLQLYVPKRILRSKKHSKPWITRDIINLKRRVPRLRKISVSYFR